jgi:hypothetical protein
VLGVFAFGGCQAGWIWHQQDQPSLGVGLKTVQTALVAIRLERAPLLLRKLRLKLPAKLFLKKIDQDLGFSVCV